MRLAICSILLVACVALGPQVTTETADARVPRHFLGMNVDGPALAPGVEVRRQLRKIRRAGAGSVRWSLDWAAVQPYRDWSQVPAERRGHFSDVRGAPMDFRATDRFVAAAAAARLRALPVVMTAAPWVAENPFVPFSPPTDIAAFGGFARALAERYGSAGAFWKEHPRLPRRPLRVWQIWNEPAGHEGFGSPTVFWESARDPLRTYVEMLAAAHAGLRQADPRSRLVLSGLFGKSWVSLDQLYAAGARPLFDAVAIHPFTRLPDNVVRIVENARRVMRRRGDARKPLVLTEVSWPSSAGVIPSDFSVTAAEQAALLARAYPRLVRARKRLNLRGVFWYTWMSSDRSAVHWPDHSGLLTRAADGRITRKPAFFAFRRVARRLTGAR